MPRLFPPSKRNIEEYRKELEGFFPGAKLGALWDVNAALADQFDLGSGPIKGIPERAVI